MIKNARASFIFFGMIMLTTLPCSAQQVKEIDSRGLQTLLKNKIPIIDIRRDDEWKKTGVVEGSMLLTAFARNGQLNPDFMPSFMEAFRPEDEIILICRTGNRSATMGKMLAMQLGYVKVYNVSNGITGWIKDGMPVVTMK